RTPLLVRLFLAEPASADLPSAEDRCSNEEAGRIGHTEYFETIQKYHNFFESIYQQELSKKRSNTPLHTLNKTEYALEKSVTNISDIEDSPASLPQTQQ
ncbi:hypothetical protein EDC96DRAFT_450322, partial [Choanephora cucurbitarum]